METSHYGYFDDMQVSVKYFASLRESVGKAEDRVQITAGMSVADLWEQCAPSESSQCLFAVNMAYVNSEHILQNGDEVAFFPPVTGG